ncbi:GlsB/YeaQ/YmgE family stress response membrane protein [Trueperella sp. LYQ143]|uniref:GlsB/YeaQ/YmgE family stress response membrane protein n=1 Tax=unclassified Trueperella TaxID=2630174 RepID=UPI00398373E6
MGNIIGTIIFGGIIGFLARFLRKDAKNVSVIATVVLGVCGVAIANLILGLFHYSANTPGIDWWRWIISTIAAMVVIGVYLGMTGKSSRK